MTAEPIHGGESPLPPPAPRPIAQIDVSKLELADILLLDDVARGRPYELTAVIRMLDRVMVGGVAGHHISHYQPLLRIVLATVQELANPKT